MRIKKLEISNITTASSKDLLKREVSHGSRWVFLLLLGGILFSGCIPPAATPESFFQLTPERARYKAQQTRTFDTSDEKELLSASAAVLQDLGFQIQEVSTDMGILKAMKERGAREYGQEIAQGLVMILSIFAQTVVVSPVDVHQQIAATLATRPVEGDSSRFTVRIVFHRTVWKGHGQSGDHHIPPGIQEMEMIHDPMIYQQFFAKLSKSVFLEAHEI